MSIISKHKVVGKKQYINVASNGEPIYTGAANQHALLNTDFTEPWYQDVTQMGEYPFSADDPFYGPFRIIPEYSFLPHGIHSNPDIYQIINDSEGRWFRAQFTGVATTANGYQTWPSQAISTVRTTCQSFYQRWKPGVLPQVKNNETWWSTINPEDSGRMQIATSPNGFGDMYWEIHDQVTSNPRTALQNPIGNGLRDIADGHPHLITIRCRPNTKSSGTVNRLVKQISPLPFTFDTFSQSQAGVLHNGDRILVITDSNNGGVPNIGEWCSGAEFLVSNFDGDKRATLTRQSNILGGTVSYSGQVSFAAEVIYTGIFSESQAGLLSNGDVLAMNNAGGMVPTRVVAFDGTFTCELPQDDPPALAIPIIDRGGLWFSRPADQDGFVQYWIDHQKLIDCSRGVIGITPPGGRQPWTTAQCLTTLVTGASFSKIIWGETQAADSDPWYMDIGIIPGTRFNIWWEP